MRTQIRTVTVFVRPDWEKHFEMSVWRRKRNWYGEHDNLTLQLDLGNECGESVDIGGGSLKAVWGEASSPLCLVDGSCFLTSFSWTDFACLSHLLLVDTGLSLHTWQMLTWAVAGCILVVLRLMFMLFYTQPLHLARREVAPGWWLSQHMALEHGRRR